MPTSDWWLPILLAAYGTVAVMTSSTESCGPWSVPDARFFRGCVALTVSLILAIGIGLAKWLSP